MTVSHSGHLISLPSPSKIALKQLLQKLQLQTWHLTLYPAGELQFGQIFESTELIAFIFISFVKI